MHLFTALFLLTPVSCEKAEAPPEPEPLLLPSDPASAGVPVGVMTWALDETTVEVWYPASDAEAGSATESPDYGALIPASVTDVLGEVLLPTMDSGAVRDAALRPPESPYPVVLFSHGFGAFRSQSIDLTVHLASRGYIVVAPDHPGRMLGDLLPCLFSPALDGCDLTGITGEDPGPDHLEDALERLEEEADGFFEGAVDLSRVAVMGHSAGASSAASFAEDERISAALPLSTGSAPARDVPTLVMAGDCDGVISAASSAAAFEEVSEGHLITLADAGHQAFSDICALDLPGLAAELLVGRDDVNETLLDSLFVLAEDGCPGYTPSSDACEAFGDLGETQTAVRHYVTVFLDEHLYGAAPGVQADVLPGAAVQSTP